MYKVWSPKSDIFGFRGISNFKDYVDFKVSGR